MQQDMIGNVDVDVQNTSVLHRGFLASCAALPDARALEIGGARYTYRELRAAAVRFASAAAGSDDEAHTAIGIFADHSLSAYAGILGTLMAGATYVPLNRRFPPARNARMLELAGAKAVVVDERCARQAMQSFELMSAHPAIIWGPDVTTATKADWRGRVLEIGHETTAQYTESHTLGDRPAYLLFTSGTTGMPKGVPVSHANALHYVHSITSRFPIVATDRCSQTFDLTFDLSVHDMFVTWNAGACLVIPGTTDLLTPVKYASDNALTVWFSVPSLAALAARRNALTPGRLPALRLSQFCGEALPSQIAQAWAAAAPASVVANLYGPTELTIACLTHVFSPEQPDDLRGFVPIGRPLNGLGCTLIDVDTETGSARESGDSQGELYVCGPQTVAGYWRDAERTAERFITLDCSDGVRRVFYRTGDIVARKADGIYRFVGRADTQVKVGGYRIELGEIDGALATYPSVAQCATVAWPTAPAAHESLVAFIVCAGEIDESALRSFLRERLPDYMQPKRIVQLEALPLNSNGKIDRAVLAATLSQ